MSLLVKWCDSKSQGCGGVKRDPARDVLSPALEKHGCPPPPISPQPHPPAPSQGAARPSSARPVFGSQSEEEQSRRTAKGEEAR